MSGLLDAVEAAIPGSLRPADEIARAAVEAVAAWLDENGGYTKVANILRAEVAPPRPTPEDVIYEAGREWQQQAQWVVPSHVHIATALRDAGMLREDDDLDFVIPSAPASVRRYRMTPKDPTDATEDTP